MSHGMEVKFFDNIHTIILYVMHTLILCLYLCIVVCITLVELPNLYDFSVSTLDL